MTILLAADSPISQWLLAISNVDWERQFKIFADVATTLGVAGLIFAYRQFSDSRAIQREATAVEIWSGYLRLALEHPMLADPADFIVLKQPSLGEANLPFRSDYKSYQWFVASLLFASERILMIEGLDSTWKRTIAQQVKLHWLFYQTTDFKPDFYSLALRKIVNDQFSDHPLHPSLAVERRRHPSS